MFIVCSLYLDQLSDDLESLTHTPSIFSFTPLAKLSRHVEDLYQRCMKCRVLVVVLITCVLSLLLLCKARPVDEIIVATAILNWWWLILRAFIS